MSDTPSLSFPSSIPFPSSVPIATATPTATTTATTSTIDTDTDTNTSTPPTSYTTTTDTTTPTSTPAPTSAPAQTQTPIITTTASSSSPSNSSSASSLSTSSTSSALAAGGINQLSSTASASFPTNADPPSTYPSSSAPVYTLSTSSPSSTSSASSGFFSNTGAVAGTFTAVGLFSIAGVIAVALFIVRRRRNSRLFEEDKEYLDKTPDLSVDPPLRQATSLDDTSNSDHVHYGAPPMALAAPPTAYYPDNAHAFHPQAFSLEAYPPQSYPVGYAQDWAAQNIYPPEDYNLVYSTQVPHVAANMPNPHQFTDVELDSTAAPRIHNVPNIPRPSVDPSTSAAPKQWENTRFSVDSFYTGMVTDHSTSPGQAL